VRETPTWRWRSETLGSLGELVLKLELLQHGGSFKPRGALSVMHDLPPEVLARGVTAVSAGNHAIAVAFAAQQLGVSAKVVVIRTASPVRLARCRAFGAGVVLADDAHQAFETVRAIERDEGRTFVHPFEGPRTALGTATLGLEWWTQARALGAPLDAVIVPIGGGGLAAGIAAAVKQLDPACAVYGVEPVGADTMYRSFQTGRPESLDRVRTIADSLGAPYALPYSFGLCRRFIDEVVLVDDDAICRAMALLFDEMKLAPEPAAAATTAAALGPLRDRLEGKRVGAIVCGSNIDVDTFHEYIRRGEASREG
jgi:threonine dehydratase